MPALKVRRIERTSPRSGSQLASLRDQFHGTGEFPQNARDRKLSQAVFGEPLTPPQAVERICTDVRDQGVQAVLRYTEAFDKVKLDPDKIRISPATMAKAAAEADPDFIEAIRSIRESVISFQLGILHSSALLTAMGMHEVHLRYRPMRRVGICVPGGVAPLPSTLLMTACPAQAAGVKELAVVMPPNAASNPDMLTVCHLLGIKEVYGIGGAQAVAALAYGVDGIDPVEMIVGPGNIFVTLAKKFVFGTVAIDSLAGPSEVVVVADESSSAKFIASDLLAQAEHSADAKAVLVTWHEDLLDQVQAALEEQIKTLDRADIARESLERFGAMVLVENEEDAVRVVNDLAPEHLHLQTRDPEAFAEEIDNAGAIFLGAFTPVAVGDYAAGPSHVLPTNGTARFSSGLTANDFLKRTSLMSFTRNGLRDVSEEILLIAAKEGLTAHAASVEMRLNDTPTPAARPKKVEKTKK